MNKIIFFVSLTLLVSCSQEQESMSNALQTDDSTWDENGVGFAEFWVVQKDLTLQEKI